MVRWSEDETMIRVTGKVDLLENINVMVSFERGWTFSLSMTRGAARDTGGI